MPNTVSHLLARLLNSGAAFEAPLARRSPAQDASPRREAQGAERQSRGDSACAEGAGEHEGNKVGH